MEARNKRIFDLWLACCTQEEIAAEVSCDRIDVTRQVDTYVQNGKPANLNKSEQAAASHVTDFEPPIYNVWKQQEKTPGVKQIIRPPQAHKTGSGSTTSAGVGVSKG